MARIQTGPGSAAGPRKTATARRMATGGREATAPLRSGLAKRVRSPASAGGPRGDGFVRETFRLERVAARERARQWLDRWPRAAYWSEVESWRVVPGSGGDAEMIEFTMRRLPTAD